jgi:antitoxin (DNA-binding transcriptional repressor) of toxin-antitoxin stability system
MSQRIVTAAVGLFAVAVAIGAAQDRVEIRKEGAAVTLVAAGRPLAAIVPYAEKGFAAGDAVVEVKPGLFEWTRTFRYEGQDHVRPARNRSHVARDACAHQTGEFSFSGAQNTPALGDARRNRQY